MIKKIGIVSLSSGVFGESFVEHEIKIGLDRLNKLGVEIEFLPNSLKGIDFLKIIQKLGQMICYLLLKMTLLI